MKFIERESALVLTGLISGSMVGLTFYSISTLSSRDWCAQIMASEKFTNEATRASSDTVKLVIEKCADTLFEQLQSVGWVSMIVAGALALSMAAMFIVKFAGAHASGTVAGQSVNIGPGQQAANAADYVAEKATDAATEVKDGTNP